MSIKTKVAGSWKTVTQPWVKVDDVHKRAVKVYVKLNDAWTEAWPLQPGPVTSAATTTKYRNDRIEIDVDWAAPAAGTGEMAVKYIVDLDIGTSPTGPFSYSYTTTVNSPTTALTLTNGGNGYHTFAGKKVYVSIIAQSAAGRNGVAVLAPAVTVAQLPAPAAPTTYDVDIVACQATHRWTIVTGRTVDGVELMTKFNGVGTVIKRYADTVTSAAYESWNPATVGAGDVACYLRTYGPGGVSAWKTVTGAMPGPVKTSGYRFLNGKMRVDVANIDPKVEVWYTDRDGPWHNDGIRYPGADTIVIQDSADWPRTLNREWMMKLRPKNVSDVWTGRDQDLPWIVKVPEPIIVHPTASNTRRAGAWRNDVSEWQGSSSSGQNTAYFFYSGEFWQLYRDNVVGYKLNVSSASIGLIRELSGGSGNPVRPRLMVHRANHQGHDLSHAGAYDSTALARGAASWCALPADWAEMLLQGTNEWRGVGLFHSNTALVGGVSAEYMVIKAYGQGSVGGHPVGTVRIYHDG